MLKKKQKKLLGSSSEVEYSRKALSDFGYNYKGRGDLIDEIIMDDNIEDYYGKAGDSAYNLVKDYGYEKNKLGEYYGAQALWELSQLDEKLKQAESQSNALGDLVDKYPDSSLAKQAKSKLDSLKVYNYDNAGVSVSVGNYVYDIRLVFVEEPSAEEASAEFTVGDAAPKSFRSGEKVWAEDTEYIKVTDLDDDVAVVEYKRKIKEKERLEEKRNYRLEKGKSLEFKNGEITINLNKVNLERTAEIELISKVPDGTSEANFTVAIGIEKRAIQLSPERTQKMIDNLNDSIDKWSETVEDLGDIVEKWKGACFTVSAGLMIKNLLSNMGGKSMARRTAMSNHWKQYCIDYTKEHGGTIDSCYAKHNSQIENSVTALESGINRMNSDMEAVGNRETTDMAEEFAKEKFIPFYTKNKDNPNVNFSVDGQSKTLGEVFTDKNQITQMVKKGDLSLTEMRDIMLYGGLVESKAEGVSDMASNALSTSIQSVARRAQNQPDSGLVVALKDVKNGGLSFEAVINSLPDSRAGMAGGMVETFNLPESKSISDITDLSRPITIPSRIKTKKYTLISTDEGVLLIPVESGTGKGGLVQRNFVEKTGDAPEIAAYTISEKSGKLVIERKLTRAQRNSALENRGPQLIEISRDLCDNQYTNPEVRYYEREPYKGLPEVVPLDLNKGWYAATKQILPIGGQQASFQSSGAVSNLWLCNVGEGGREEWGLGTSNDICIRVDYNTGQPLDSLGCVSGDEARNLARAAKSIVENAASKYSSATKSGKVTLDLLSGRKSVDTKSAVSRSGLECQDFMSPKDCEILFNVCDPVLCPTSRCDFGGTHRVDNVIQSGIVGSLALCLPNFKGFGGDVYVPICLTGLYAGLDSYVSILTAHRDCLQENLDSGAHVGICDEMYSIYLCEFFWRQAAPLANLALPKLIEYMYTGGERQSRGGGEYLTTTDAWDTAKESMDYFTNSYGLNVFKAFRSRSTANIGSEVCKAFISTSYPTGENVFDQLLEPDSPVQFYARFDEIPFSDATVPATSQYKVYYHIFAGRNSGHYYQVYLKNPPEVGAYAGQPNIIVDSGYVGEGQSVDKTKDFTAPAAYKELCVRINNQEECGFQQVTTSFAINYLSDQYAADQASQGITKENECISGTRSVSALAQPNIMEGIGEAVTPSLYSRGIIRVCSNWNPGNQSDPGRWEEIGYCDTEKIKCWLDTKSVKSTIDNLDLEQQALSEAERIARSGDIAAGNVFDETETNSRIEAVKTKIGNMDFLDMTIDSVEVQELLKELKVLGLKGYFNYQKANAAFLEFQIYKTLTESLINPELVSDSLAADDTATEDSEETSTLIVLPKKGLSLSGDYNPGQKIFIEKDGKQTSLYFEASKLHDAGGELGTVNGDNRILLILGYKDRIDAALGTDKDYFEFLNDAEIRDSVIISEKEIQLRDEQEEKALSSLTRGVVAKDESDNLWLYWSQEANNPKDDEWYLVDKQYNPISTRVEPRVRRSLNQIENPKYYTYLGPRLTPEITWIVE